MTMTHTNHSKTSPSSEASSLKEKAIGAPEAKRENLALMIEPKEGKAFLYSFSVDLAQKDPQGSKGILVKGFISVKPLERGGWGPGIKDFYTVALSAAETKYGPLLYDVALGMKYPGWVMSDRGSVSAAANRVWGHYLRNRPDVERVFLVDHFLGSEIGAAFKKKLGAIQKVGSRGVDETKESSLLRLGIDHLDKISYFLPAGSFQGIQQMESYLDGLKVGLERRLRVLNARVEEVSSKDLEGFRQSLRDILRAEKLLRVHLRQYPEAWAFRMRAPGTAKEGPALANLLGNHKRNEESLSQGIESGKENEEEEDLVFGSPSEFRDAVRNRGYWLFDEKFF